MDPASVEDRAREILDPAVADYIAGGAGQEITVADNVAAWMRWRLRPHVLTDVATVDTTVELLGRTAPAPILVAPTAMHGLVTPEAELATAAASRAGGATLVLSMAANTALEHVASAEPELDRWMQIYVQRDHDLTREVCARAARAGYRALVVTVDSPVTSHRPRNVANAFNVPAHLALPNLAPGAGSGPDIYRLVAGYDASVTPADLPRLADWAGGLPVVVKGVLRGDDARRAVDAGATGVVVSNHGGRQLDTVQPTAHVLAEVVDAVDGRAEVYVDGGIRSGVDVLKALALGARAVLVGRPVLWALAVGGAPAATALLEELRADLSRAAALCGVTSLRDVARDLLAR